MGSGGWTRDAFVTYSTSRGRGVSPQGICTTDSLQDFYRQTSLHKDLNPKNVIRECCDSEEHPNTVPVILALDVTGSMRRACLRTAQELNRIMTSLYDEITDVEFLIMGIGDLAYDKAPIQASQFESDVRIAENLDKIYMEHGGGGNFYESYTAAWYFGLNHTKLDCWKRSKKGIIITMGDESLNPYLPREELANVLGDIVWQDDGNIETKPLYELAKDKYDIYHIAINDSGCRYEHHKERIHKTWGNFLGQDFYVSTLEDLSKTIKNCIMDSIAKSDTIYTTTPIVPFDAQTGYISW